MEIMPGETAIGLQIQKLRADVCMEARHLAEAVRLDPSTLSKIENGKRAVRTDELLSIAKALGVSPLAILEPDSLLARLPLAARSSTDHLDSAVHKRLEALAELDNVLSAGGVNGPVPNLPLPPSNSHHESWLQVARRLADWSRRRLDIVEGAGRLACLAKSIEDELGVDVLIEEYDSGTNGAAITDREFPFILINASQAYNRALFTLAHELGHVLADDGTVFRIDLNLAGTDERERVANAFAAELLMPEEIVRNYLDSWGRNIRSLAKMMTRFGVSWQSLVYRLHNLQMIDADRRDNLRAIGFTGLLRELDDKALVEELTALRSRLQRRPPGLLESRLWRGYELGLVSVRPLAGLLGVEPEDLLINTETPGIDQDVVGTVTPGESLLLEADELYLGDPF
ncbi:XRE family transcriptional regulator [Ferrimicrobium sp.]|jgi:Zn-dependent peptidase ImmA (M78 family)/DNA-binding Xre family transcriptional regulator|uniref:helix-turn-helix domain-containing protein n=1 Tax=Ferrimicrobium sp. TaxID=2926050 RepID=UPI00260D091A|nr:XRE family transcriptional regulator [Ferrimicrobium sp.]